MPWKITATIKKDLRTPEQKKIVRDPKIVLRSLQLIRLASRTALPFNSDENAWEVKHNGIYILVENNIGYGQFLVGPFPRKIDVATNSLVLVVKIEGDSTHIPYNKDYNHINRTTTTHKRKKNQKNLW